jgi:hypothetical protein
MTSTTYTISGFIRQNPWGKLDNQLDSVYSSKIVHCPWGHTLRDVEEYESNPGGFKKKYAKRFVAFPTNSYILVGAAGGERALLVQLVSQPLTGILPHYIIARSSTRECGHALTQPGRGCIDGCASCEDSIIAVYNESNVTKKQLLDHIIGRDVIEPFHTIYRKVNVIGWIDLLDIEAGDLRRYVTTCIKSIKSTTINIPSHIVTN